MIEVIDLVKNYGSVPAVRGVSLGVARGEVVVLIGPSGCGKSTLLRCVHLLEEPTSGTIRVGAQRISFGGSGKALTGRKLAAYRSRIGMVFQHFELFPHMTALQNVIEGPVTVKRMDRRAAADLARGLPRQSRSRRQGTELPGPALGRAGATRRHRPGARHVARGDAV